MTRFNINREFLNHITVEHKRKLEDALCESQQFQNYPEAFLAQLPREIGLKFPRRSNTKIQASYLIEACLQHNAMYELIAALRYLEGESALCVKDFETVWFGVIFDVCLMIPRQNVEKPGELFVPDYPILHRLQRIDVLAKEPSYNDSEREEIAPDSTVTVGCFFHPGILTHLINALPSLFTSLLNGR